MAEQPKKVIQNDFNLTVREARNVESNFARWVSDASISRKRQEHASQTEGRVISQLSDEVLRDNPANTLYDYTMDNFNKAYSQKKRATSGYTDCSAFVSNGMQDLIREMYRMKHNNGQAVFNGRDLSATMQAFQSNATTVMQETELRKLYASKGAKPDRYVGANAFAAFANETEVGKVIIMDKDGRIGSHTDRHIWMSVRDPKTNKIAWAESTVGTGVIISSPEELKERYRAINNNNGRVYHVFDPFIGNNRKVLNEYDAQAQALTIAYNTQKKEMQESVRVSGNNQHVDINQLEQFNEMRRRLENQKHDIEHLNIKPLQEPNTHNPRTLSL